MYREILRIVKSEDKILKNESLKNHSTFKIGGEAKYIILPSSEDEIVSLIKFLKDNNEKFYVIGNGSNLLFSDEGFDGVIVKIAKNFSNVRVNGNEIYAQSGVTLARIANIALENNLTGFEFASGIPGTIGGAVKMNAGAYGGEIKDVVVSTKYLDKNGEIKERVLDEQGFSYRKSAFTDDEVILSSKIVLKEGSYDEIKSYMSELNSKRREKQPLEYPSAGSAFKRPEGYFAAKLIDDANLRGVNIGDAYVSEKHTGFIVNKGNATQKDVTDLMEYVKKVVYEKFGVKLEAEVKIVR
ncbi:MAG: UDP-N-acetylmuramate dehydrogenase [Ruminococcaceae bacterium]|nr:UDP-N-acetylmuramate dehydrogenase [Oscillospiraceae bacterium]